MLIEALPKADLAQLVEQLSCKQQVIGSSPIVGSRLGWLFLPRRVVILVFFPLRGKPAVGQAACLAWDLVPV